VIQRRIIREIAEKLLAKTRANQVNWTDHDTENTGCRLLLPHSSLEVVFHSPPAEPDRVTITVNRLEDDGEWPLAEFTASEGDEDWELYFSLYEAASRVVYRWDEVLDDLRSAVNASGPIGKGE
jgi:hypothetical protein